MIINIQKINIKRFPKRNSNGRSVVIHVDIRPGQLPAEVVIDTDQTSGIPHP